jgi:HK97 family phage prohead protease
MGEDTKIKQLDNAEPELVGDRTLRFTATTESEDRDGDIVRVQGLNTEAFEENPTFLFAHQDKEPPIGRVVKIEKRPGKMLIDVKFDPDEFSDMIFQKYKRGSMNAVSISFDPDMEQTLEREDGGLDFVEADLLEVSAVPVPANPEATAHRSKCFDSKRKASQEWAKKVFELQVKQEDGPTDFPEEGDDLKVSLRNSQYERVPLDYARRIKQEHPDIWDKGGNIQGDDSFQVLKTVIEEHNGAPQTDTQKEIVRRREAWAARHEQNHELPGVVAQIKWLVVGTRGLDHQKEVIREAIEDKSMELELTKSVDKGEALSTFLQTLIASRLDEDQPQSELIREMSSESGIPTSTIRSYLSGEIQCPNEAFIEAAADVLNVESETLAAIAARDGCDFDITSIEPEDPEEDSGHMAEEDGMDDKSKELSDMISKVPTEFQDFPIGDDPEEEWDRERSVTEAREHASRDDSGDKETIDWDLYAEHFLYYDGDEPENFTSYKFPYTYHDEDGDMYVPLQGIFVVAQFLEQEPDPPQEGDIEAAKRHIARYYTKAQEKFPDRDISDPQDVFEDIELSDKSRDMPESIAEELKARVDALENMVDQLAESKAESHEQDDGPDKSMGQTFELPVPDKAEQTFSIADESSDSETFELEI